MTIVHFPPWLEQLVLKSAFPLLSHTITSDNTELLFVHRGEGLYLALSRHKLYRIPTAPPVFRQTVGSSRGGLEERMLPAPRPGSRQRRGEVRPYSCCSRGPQRSAPEASDARVVQEPSPWHWVLRPSAPPSGQGRAKAPTPADKITSQRRRALSAASCAARGGLTARRTAGTAGT